MAFGVLLVLEMTTLLRKGDKVREDHATKADVIERNDGVGLDVFGMVIIQSSLDEILGVACRHHRLHVLRHVFHLHSPDLVEKAPHRHFQISIIRPNPNCRSRKPTLFLLAFIAYR
ncbi:hypothetical protein Hanom_Chr06g00579631 [Helianthus anomalus]